jgi:hypothetical protein
MIRRGYCHQWNRSVTLFNNAYDVRIFIKERKESLMSQAVFRFICRIITGFVLAVFIAVSAGAVDNADVYDTVELKNGDKVTGTVLTDTFTLTTPYSFVVLKKDQISEIKLQPESEFDALIELNTGGTLTGTLEETSLSFKLISGKTISLEKEECKKIIVRRDSE